MNEYLRFTRNSYRLSSHPTGILRDRGRIIRLTETTAW